MVDVTLEGSARLRGHALYLKGGRLSYAYNWVGMFEQIFSAD